MPYGRSFLKKYLIASILCLVLSGCALLVRSPLRLVLQGEGETLYHRGIFHVHSQYSHDSKASLETLLNTAHKAYLDFVVLTDHNNMDARKEYEKMDSERYPLLVIGTELSTPDGHLIALNLQKRQRQEGSSPILPK